MNLNIYNPYVRRELELYHHGINGQKWGKRNGPPYPLGSSQVSAAEKKAGWKESLNDGGETKKQRKIREYREQAIKDIDYAWNQDWELFNWHRDKRIDKEEVRKLTSILHDMEVQRVLNMSVKDIRKEQIQKGLNILRGPLFAKDIRLYRIDHMNDEDKEKYRQIKERKKFVEENPIKEPKKSEQNPKKETQSKGSITIAQAKSKIASGKQLTDQEWKSLGWSKDMDPNDEVILMDKLGMEDDPDLVELARQRSL